MNNGTMFNQREIILVAFPFSDLSNYKKRPALIISNDKFNQSYEDIICCMITSNPEAKDGIDLKQKDLEQGNIFFDSIIKPHRLFTVSKKIILKKLGLLKKNKTMSVEKKIKELVRV
ncbi:MAG: type II toxin-antitoxin system PemK/MazF family toxin [Nanoarchaeota archaeon]|nr:type II toxin-antitoxin system PemK/MazF family toxin [Nanoarchaeota archaeon]